MITLALSKGRILKQTLPLLEEIGITLKDDPFTSRKLIFATNHDDLQCVIIRATDVPTYVQFGAADVGIVGKDGLFSVLRLRQMFHLCSSVPKSRRGQITVRTLYNQCRIHHHPTD